MALERMTVRSRMLLLTSLCVANVILIGFVVQWSKQRLSDQIQKVTNVYLPAVRWVALTDMMHDSLRSTAYRALYIGILKGGQEKMDKAAGEFEESAVNLGAYVEALRQLQLPEDTMKDVDTLGGNLNDYIGKGRELIEMIKQGKVQESIQKFEEFDRMHADLAGILDKLSEKVENESLSFDDKSRQVINESEMLNWGLIVFGALFTIISSWYLARNMIVALTTITKEIRGEAEKVTDSAVQIHSSSQQLAEATTEQSSAIEETVSSMEEIGSMISQTSQNTQQMLHEAEEGTRVAKSGKDVVEAMVRSMDDLSEANQRLQGILRVIDDIRSKTKVINDIAFETRLLSFNASIEAARAGANGRGFAVVAEEVGKLAVVSSKAADEVRKLLEDSIQSVQDIVNENKKRTDAGLQRSHECEQAFSSMETLLINLNRTIESVAIAAREQEGGVKQTNRAMNEMERATQANFKGAESLANLARHLTGTSQQMLNSSDRLNMLVFGMAKHKAKTPEIPPPSGPSPQKDETPYTKDTTPSSALGNVTPDEVDRNDSRWHAA